MEEFYFINLSSRDLMLRQDLGRFAVPIDACTDAKSLYDNLQKEGSLPTERQTL